ncbi:hypothetical protein LIER_05755 [Lithospermum erythrorhizon]|uniref:Uncharacterized protein n=1 Tax=Lithospermum erythrorhizon TaxID=34254 RepID=A0AAV3P2L4_LITER
MDILCYKWPEYPRSYDLLHQGFSINVTFRTCPYASLRPPLDPLLGSRISTMGPAKISGKGPHPIRCTSNSTSRFYWQLGDLRERPLFLKIRGSEGESYGILYLSTLQGPQQDPCPRAAWIASTVYV